LRENWISLAQPKGEVGGPQGKGKNYWEVERDGNSAIE